MATTTFWTASGALLAGAATFVPIVPVAGAQGAIKRTPSGFNLFTAQQDLEIGRQSAAEIERQVTLVTTARTNQYLGSIIALLAPQLPGSAYLFQVRAINSAEVNLLALPGGQIFVTGGLLSLTRSEAEVAGVLAHAMAHIALRHGTARASRAYLSKAGLSALGALGGSDVAQRIVNATGGFGTNAVFLRFTRTDEYEADALGAELMSKAGYDPVASAAILATLRREKARPAIERYNNSHPPIADRESRIRNLSNILRHGRSEIVGGFARMRWRMPVVASLPAVPEMKVSTGAVELRATPAVPEMPAPSLQFMRFSKPDAPIEIDHPANWDAHQSGMAMSFVPSGGVVESEDGAPNLLQGMIVNYYEPFEGDVERWNKSLERNYAPFQDRSRPRGILEDATDDIVRQIIDANAWLKAPARSARPQEGDGMRGYAVRLSGRSPLTGKMERVTVYTRALPDDHVLYLACVAGGRTAASVERACTRMLVSLRVNEEPLHRAVQR
jgi:peptidase M48-like protein